MKQPNYNIETTEERIAEVNKILEYHMDELIDHFDNNFNISPKCVSSDSDLNGIDKSTLLSDGDYYCRYLEMMADYILYAEKRQSNIETQSNKDTKKRRELFSFEEISTTKDENGEQIEVEVIEDTRMSKKPEITKEDLEKYPEIKRLWDIKKKIKKLEISQKLKRSILSDLGYSINKLKISLSGQFNFHTSPTKPKYILDNDTGYFDNNDEYILVSENTIDFGNPKHIFELINNYGTLVDHSLEDCQSDIKHILFVLEELIEQTELPDYMLDILLWKIDGYTALQISNMLQLEYGLDISESRLSSIYRDIIPYKICETYKSSYEDWLYTFKVRGVWKKCSACGEIKLATDKYFRKQIDCKDGLRPECRLCEKTAKNE